MTMRTAQAAITALLLAVVTAASGLAQTADTPLPVIPGAAGFGMETPAGSGRHLLNAQLKPGWDKALVGRWQFDQGLPARGELTGDAALVKRGDGQALRLSGKGALKLPNPEGYLKPGGSFTFSAWVYMEKPLGTIARNNAGDAGQWQLAHVRHGVQKWMFLAEGETKSGIYLTADVTDPAWRHVVAQYDAESGTLRFYINASLIGATRKGVEGFTAASCADLTLGQGLTGLIDDVMLFSAALSDDDILALHAHHHGAYLGPQKTTVYKVTNLNTEGPGSLREALEAVGPRVIVFEVSGNIDFTPLGSLSIRYPYVTVAGQTAPSPGITLKGCELSIGTHDVLLQHIRIRVGDLVDPTQPVKNKSGWTQWSERDCVKVGGERIVIDHCSFSWATDELVQTRARQTTFRQNLFGECLNSPRHHKGGHSKGLLILEQSPTNEVIAQAKRDSRYVAVIGNLFALNADRNPVAQGGARIAVINNYVYGALARPGVGLTLANMSLRGSRGGGIWATVIGNHFDNVPAPVRVIARPKEVDGKVYFDDLKVTYTPAERKRHEPLIQKTLDDLQFKDYLAGVPGPTADDPNELIAEYPDPWKASHMLIFRHWMGKPMNPDTAKAPEPPVLVPGVNIKPVDAVRDWVLATAGARPADRDPVDARIVRQVRERTGEVKRTLDEVGGWPELAQNRRKLTLPDNPSVDDDGDGYTNLEEWLHGFAAEVEGRKQTR